MNQYLAFGSTPYSYENMRNKLDEFADIYEKRPVLDNRGGMKFPHMFSTWYALSTLKPKAIIESGVFKGQGTWLMEQACPEAKLYCIDIELKQIQYRSNHATYFQNDFATIDWSHLPLADTVVFFDDHQNAYERVKTAKWMGFKHLMFEDNYPASQGDCYSLKKVFMNAGFSYQVDRPVRKRSLFSRLGQILRLKPVDDEIEIVWDVYPNKVDELYLRCNLEVYYEFPPVFRPEYTRWGDRWDDDKYPTPEPLLSSLLSYKHLYPDEAVQYTWLCYARLI